MKKTLIDYFKDEIRTLRHYGREFSEKHPKVANALRFGKGLNDDPYMNRLTQSFALLTSKIHKKIDAQCEQLPRELLNALYPHALLPVPSCNILKFTPQPHMETSTLIPTHTELVVKHKKEDYFQTSMPVELLPVYIASQIFETTHNKTQLTVHCSAYSDTPSIASLNMKALPFHIQCEGEDAYHFYRILFTQLSVIRLKNAPDDAHPKHLAPSHIAKVGLQHNERMLDSPENSFPGLMLLKEFMHYPERFLFFKLDLSQHIDHTYQKHLLIEFEFNKIIKTTTNPLALYCTPIINLHASMAQSIRIDHTKDHYPISSLENDSIYRVIALHCTDEETGDTLNTQDHSKPVYRNNIINSVCVYWKACRRDDGHHELSIDLKNKSLEEASPLFATPEVLSYSRDEPSLSSEIYFYKKQYDSVSSAAPLHRFSPPTEPLYPEDNTTLIRLLLRGQYDITQEEECKALLIALLNESIGTQHSSPVNANCIEHVDIVTKHHREYPSNQYECFTQHNITVTINEEAIENGILYLFGTVLFEFISGYTSINSLFSLTLNNHSGEQKAHFPCRTHRA